jgi:dipeptidyl aminopeptidase/acylaminoacyl peptidase
LNRSFSPLWAAFALALASAAHADIVDFAPDGALVAAPLGPAATPALALAPVTGGASRFVPGGEKPSWVNWSPDGASILFGTVRDGKPVAKLYDVKSSRTSTLGGGLTAPTAWREDGKRFAAVQRVDGGPLQLVQYSLADNGIPLRVELPVAPSPLNDMVWLPGTDDIAYLGLDGNVHTIEAGEAHKITTSNDIIGLGLMKGGKELVWARKGPNLRYILLSLYAWDLNKRSVRKLPFPDRVSLLNPNPRTAPQSVDAVAFSPGGTHFALRVTMPPAVSATAPGKPAPKPGSSRSAIYIVHIDGTRVRYAGGTGESRTAGGRPSPIPGERVEGAWSSDGSLFALWRLGHEAAVTLTRADGGFVRNLTAKAAP